MRRVLDGARDSAGFRRRATATGSPALLSNLQANKTLRRLAFDGAANTDFRRGW